MSKSVYSLILNDDVVAAIDRLAYRNRTSRSEMITRILAEHVSVATPEQRNREILSHLSDLLGMGDTFLLLPPSAGMLSASSALAYKYHPTVKYSVELNAKEGVFGKLRVSMRTQNPALIEAFADFCRLFAAIERERLGDVDYSIGAGRMTRALTLRSHREEGLQSPPLLGALLGRYVCTVDECLKTYFAHIENPAEATMRMRAVYDRYLRGGEETV